MIYLINKRGILIKITKKQLAISLIAIVITLASLYKNYEQRKQEKEQATEELPKIKSFK